MIDEHNVSGRVSRTVEYVKLLVAKGDDLTRLHPARGHEIRDGGKSKHLALHGEGLEQEGVVAVRAGNRQSPRGGEFYARADMIEMTMCEQQVFGLQVEIGDQRENSRCLATGIDDRCPAGAFTPEHGTVLLKRGDQQDVVVHDGRQQALSA